MDKKMTNKAKVISAFPACGKTYFYNNQEVFNRVLDSDSSEFSWIKDENGNNTKERNPDFPENYIKHIKENIYKADIIFVSSHDVVRDALKDSNMQYTIIYPSINLKNEWIRRFHERGNNEGFIKFIDSNFKNFIESIDNEVYPNKIKLVKIDDYINKDLIKKCI